MTGSKIERSLKMPAVNLSRPRPPADLVSMEGMMLDRFVPAPELAAWIRSAYVADGGPLYFEGHAHLDSAALGCLWTNAPNSRHMRSIVGEAELAKNIGARVGKWQRARAEQQIVEWFGGTPDFLLTFDAVYADQADDASFCALVDHELCHCAQERDEFDQPKFDKATGLPKFAMRGHDVEEFASVVRRFGVDAAGERAVEFVLAAAAVPSISRVKVAGACGTCAAVRKAA